MQVANLRNDPYILKLAEDATARDAARRRLREGSPTDKEHWYLTYIGARSDDRAIERLTRCEFEFYRPMLRKMAPIPRERLSRKQRNDPFRPHMPKLTPFLGKYLPVRFDLRRADWSEVFQGAGIWGIQVYKDAVRPLPAPVSDSIIEAIKAREVDGAIPGEMSVRQFAYEIGETVRVSDPDNTFYGYEMPIEEMIPRELLSKKDLAAIDGDDGVRLTWFAFGKANCVLLPISSITKVE